MGCWPGADFRRLVGHVAGEVDAYVAVERLQCGKDRRGQLAAHPLDDARRDADLGDLLFARQVLREHDHRA